MYFHAKCTEHSSFHVKCTVSGYRGAKVREGIPGIGPGELFNTPFNLKLLF
jgi:hypothetical protein